MDEATFTMLRKKRCTFPRSLRLAISLVAISLAVHVSLSYYENYFPVDFERNDARGKAVRILKNADRQQRDSVLQKPRPCKLYRLENSEKAPRYFSPPLCSRVDPVSGSCDVADKLFLSRPPATCEHQTSHTFCNLTKSAGGYQVNCSPDKCKFHLSASTVLIHSGQLQWRHFHSSIALEEWISFLIKPSDQKKHFGFLFIACGKPSVVVGDVFDRRNGYSNDEIPDEEIQYDALQLLILPPSGPVHPPGIRPGRTGVNININFLLIDSVSHQHFFRSLPQTVKFLEKLHFNKTARTSVLDFDLVQAVRSRTFETLQALFSGEIDPSVQPFGVLDYPPEPLKVEHLLKKLKEHNYKTLWVEDLCYRWEWGLPKDLLVHNKSLTKRQTWLKWLHALSQAHIDSVEVMYSMCKVLHENGVPDQFHGPDAVCMNGRHQHEYIFEYLTLYQEAMQTARQPYLSIFSTNVGHEETGRRIQTMDSSLSRYLQKVATQTNTLTILFSDHGNSYGDFLQKTLEGRLELFHPFLFMIVPEQVAARFGAVSMRALHINQHRLISVLDLHYMLQAIATNFRYEVAKGHVGYNVTSKGLLDEISPHRTCNHIPRIMPNLCICENFDMPVDSDSYHALFAHLAIGRLNNEIQKQFRQTVLPSGVNRAFGHCQQLHLIEFKNLRKSFAKNMISLKMDLVVPYGEMPADYFELGMEAEFQVFFVSMQVHLGSRENGSSIFLEKVDRITPYSNFGVCADKTVRVQLCVCDTNINATKNFLLETMLPTVAELSAHTLDLETEILLVENSDSCLYLIQHKNDNGGVFSVANTCAGKVFDFLFDMEVNEMYLSDNVPIEDTVYPGQEIFLCMAVKNAAKADWSWSYSLHHRMGIL